MAFNIDQLKRDLARHEGVEHTVYSCPAGKQTIGVGRNLEDVGLSDSEIDFLLENDIVRCVKEARMLVESFDVLSDSRQEVVLNIIVNFGAPGFGKFK